MSAILLSFPLSQEWIISWRNPVSDEVLFIVNYPTEHEAFTDADRCIRPDMAPGVPMLHRWQRRGASRPEDGSNRKYKSPHEDEAFGVVLNSKNLIRISVEII